MAVYTRKGSPRARLHRALAQATKTWEVPQPKPEVTEVAGGTVIFLPLVPLRHGLHDLVEALKAREAPRSRDRCPDCGELVDLGECTACATV